MAKVRMSALVFVVMVAAFVLLPEGPAAAAPYRIIQLNQGVVSDDLLPTINNRGEVVFFHAGCQFTAGDPPDTYVYTETGKYQLYQPGRLTTLNIPSNVSNYYPSNYSHAPPLLFNDRRQLGYRITDYNDGGKYKVYFHDGPAAAPQLLSSGSNGNVQLNQKGQMAWTAWDAAGNLQVYFFTNGTGAPITDYPYSSSAAGLADDVSLNDNGELVWVYITSDALDYVKNFQHYLNGITTCLYTTTASYVSEVQINNLGQVAWIENNGFLSDIMLYEGGHAGKLPGGEGFLGGCVVYLQINNRGQVMWLGQKEGDTEYNIYLYSDGRTTRVTNYQSIEGIGTRFDLWQNWLSDAKTKFAPHMNNKGEIVWVTRVPNAFTSYYWDMAVHVYSRGEITQMDGWTVDPTMTAWSDQFSTGASFAQINDAGQVVWSRYRGPLVPDGSGRFQMYLATPPRTSGYLYLLLLMD